MVVNGSAVVDPAESCPSLSADGSVGGFADGSTLPRCERPVSSIVCVHLDPPPLVEGSDGGVSLTPAPTLGFDPQSYSSGAGAASSNADGDDWNSGWDNSGESGGGDEDKEAVRLQWTRDLCGGNGTGNGTASGLWDYVDDVEESVVRYKVSRRGWKGGREGGGQSKQTAENDGNAHKIYSDVSPEAMKNGGVRFGRT